MSVNDRSYLPFFCSNQIGIQKQLKMTPFKIWKRLLRHMRLGYLLLFLYIFSMLTCIGGYDLKLKSHVIFVKRFFPCWHSSRSGIIWFPWWPRVKGSDINALVLALIGCPSLEFSNLFFVIQYNIGNCFN